MLLKPTPVTFEEALDMMLNSGEALDGTERESVPFMQSVGRILAEDILSDINMPPFNKAAMDGYACRKSDIHNELSVIETIGAGKVPQKTVGENECAKIMTGAMMPEGADTILIVEDCKILPNGRVKFLKEISKSNICYLAEDVKRGDIVIPEGTRISTRHIPTLAGTGKTEVMVYKAPQVAVISTGDELVEPDKQPETSQIRNSNSYSILAQLQSSGISGHYLGIAKDDREEIRKKFQEASFADITVFSGAVSMGDYDYIPEILQEQGVEILFHGVSAKPGQKTIFGKKGNRWYLGVPGNPVSSFVQIQFLLLPFIYKLMHGRDEALRLQMRLRTPYNRKRGRNKEFIPVKIHPDSSVEKVEYHGSGHINSLGYADGFMVVERGVTEIQAGELVDVRPF